MDCGVAIHCWYVDYRLYIKFSICFRSLFVILAATQRRSFDSSLAQETELSLRPVHTRQQFVAVFGNFVA